MTASGRELTSRVNHDSEREDRWAGGPVDRCTGVPVYWQCARAHCSTTQRGTGARAGAGAGAGAGGSAGARERGTGGPTSGRERERERERGKTPKKRERARVPPPPPCLEGGALGSGVALAGFGLNPHVLGI